MNLKKWLYNIGGSGEPLGETLPTSLGEETSSVKRNLVGEEASQDLLSRGTSSGEES